MPAGACMAAVRGHAVLVLARPPWAVACHALGSWASKAPQQTRHPQNMLAAWVPEQQAVQVVLNLMRRAFAQCSGGAMQLISAISAAVWRPAAAPCLLKVWACEGATER